MHLVNRIFERILAQPERATPALAWRPHEWMPIESAPSDQYILLGWSHGDGDYDWFITAGQLHNGLWLDGPGAQPDWWMSEPDFRNRKPIARAPNNEVLVLIWEDEDSYDFGVGELIDGIWHDGPAQPTGWIPVDPPPTTCIAAN